MGLKRRLGMTRKVKTKKPCKNKKLISTRPPTNGKILKSTPLPHGIRKAVKKKKDLLS